MDWTQLITKISVTAIPLLIGGLGTAAYHAISWLNAKAAAAHVSTNAAVQAAYEHAVQQATADANATIQKTVIALNQTTVNPLKQAGQFTPAAAQDVAQTALARVEAILSSETKKVLAQATGDVTQYLQNGIETAVAEAPNRHQTPDPAASPTPA